MLKSYKELKVWQKAYQTCLDVYHTTKKFPPEEKFGLTAQIRRAAISIPSNIAEGYGRKTTGEYIQALYVAYGSLCELQTQILLSKDLGYLDGVRDKGCEQANGDVERLLKGLIKSLQNKRLTP